MRVPFGQADVQLLEALGLPPRDLLACLLARGREPEAVLEALMARPMPLTHKARLLAGALQMGLPREVVERARKLAHLHPVSLRLAEATTDRQLEQQTVLDSPFQFRIAPHGLLHVEGTTARTLPVGLASPGTIILDGLVHLERLMPLPEAGQLHVRDCAVRSIDLRGTPLRNLFLRNCPLLRSVRTGAIESLVIEHCPSLVNVRIEGPVAKELRILDCGWLEQLDLAAPIRGDLRLRELRRLPRLPHDLEVAGNLEISRVALRVLPDQWRCQGKARFEDCPALLSLGRPAEPVRTLELESCDGLRRFGPGFVVLGDLSIKDCAALSHLDDAVAIGGALRLQGCSAFRTFGPSFRPPATLSLRHLPALVNLPARETPYADLELVALTAVHRVPTNLRVNGALQVHHCTPVVQALERLRVRDETA